MSDTPRMDAVVAPFIGSDGVTVQECDALLDEGRKLERELNEAQALISRLRAHVQHAYWEGSNERRGGGGWYPSRARKVHDGLDPAKLP